MRPAGAARCLEEAELGRVLTWPDVAVRTPEGEVGRERQPDGGHPPGIGRLWFERRQQVERLSHSLAGHRKRASFGGKGFTEHFPNVRFYRELGSHRKGEVARDRPPGGTGR